MRLLHADAAPGDHQLHRRSEADDERQPHRHAVAADDVPAPLERAELGVLGGYANVGQQRRLEPGGERIPVHSGDHRLEDVGLACVATCAGAVVQADAEGIVVADLAETCRVLQIPASAEGRLPGAGDHEDERIIVVAKALPGMVQLRVHRSVDRVVLIRAVVGQRHDMPSLLVQQRLVVHRSSLVSGALSPYELVGERSLAENRDPEKEATAILWQAGAGRPMRTTSRTTALLPSCTRESTRRAAPHARLGRGLPHCDASESSASDMAHDRSSSLVRK